MFDNVPGVRPRGPSLRETELSGWLARATGLDSPDVTASASRTAVLDVIDYPLRKAWLRRSSVNRPMPPGTMRIETLGRLLEEGAGHLERARAADRVVSRESAVRARELAAFARARPASLMDRGEGEVGAASAASRSTRPAVLVTVSEWAADEAAAALGLSTSAATTLLTECLVLVDLLPRTLTMLEQGQIGWPQAQVMAELLAPVRDDKRAEAESRLLARAEGKTREQLRAAARRVVARVDAKAAADRLVRAIRDRSVTVFPGEDGMSSMYAAMTTPVARACYAALERYAEECAVEGDDRTKAQRMVDCLIELILRPGEHDLPPVQVQLTVVASTETLRGGDEPGEVDGHVVPAALVRELAYTLGLLPRPSNRQPEPAEDAPVHPPIPTSTAATDAAMTDAALPDTAATDAAATDAAATDTAASSTATTDTAVTRGTRTPIDPTSGALGDDVDGGHALAALRDVRRTAGTALAHRPHIAVVDQLSGTLLALTDAAGIQAGCALGPPPDSPGYRPREALERFVRLRDRRCRFPGCRARARRCDLDHTRPWPAGPTAHGNLCCLCEHHHRLSHQAPGWTLSSTADGGLSWTTPGGEILTTYPPPFGAGEGCLTEPGVRRATGGSVFGADAGSIGTAPSLDGVRAGGEAVPPEDEPDPPPF
jgi:hypothetical protein